MECPKCKGTGRVDAIFRIPIWHGAQANAQVILQSRDDDKEYWNDHEAIEQTVEDFHAFISAHAHGVFHDGLAKLFRQD